MNMKPVLKKIVLGAAFLPALPFILLSKFGEAFGSETLFTTCGCFLSLFPGKAGSYLRLAFYKGTLKSVSSEVIIGFGSYFSKRSAVVGSNVCIGSYCILGNVTLEDRLLLASRVSIPSGLRQHSLRYATENASEETIFDHITIGRESWIGEGAIIMADVGERSIVSAGSVVTRAMPGGRIIAGNPARPLMEIRKAPAMTGAVNA